MSKHRVAALSELEDDSAKQVTVEGKALCIARSAGTVYAVSDWCTHAVVSLSEGTVEDGTVECWLHGAVFDLATGEPLGLPATQPLPTYAVTVEGDDVLVEMES